MLAEGLRTKAKCCEFGHSTKKKKIKKQEKTEAKQEHTQTIQEQSKKHKLDDTLRYPPSPPLTTICTFNI